MEDEHQQLMQSLVSKIDNQSMMNFPQNSFGIPEQLFADSSSSETCIEEVIIGPDITTSEPISIDILDLPESDSSKEPTPAMSQSIPGSIQPVALSSPLRITAVPATKPEVLKQTNNKLFLIPMGSMDASMLQSSLKVPSGQNIIILKHQDLIKSVEENRLKVNMPLNVNQHTAVHSQNQNITQQGMVIVGNQRISTQASPSQAVLIVQAHGPSQVTTMETNVQANLVQENQGNQLRKKNQAETNLQVNRAPTQAESKSQPSIQVANPGGFSDQNMQADNLRASQVNQAVKPAPDKPKVVVQMMEGTKSNVVKVEQSPSMIPLDHVAMNKLIRKPAVSIGQPLVKASREIQTKRALQAVKIMNNFEIQAQKSMLRNPNFQPVKVQQAVQISHMKPTPLHTATTSCKPFNKVSYETQVHQTKPSTPTHLNRENTLVKSNVSQGMQTMPSKEMGKPQYNAVQSSPTKAVMGIPKTLQESLSKTKNPIPQGNYVRILTAPKDSTKIQISTDQPVWKHQNSSQATPIVWPANRGAMASAFSQVSVPKKSSSAPVAVPIKVHDHATSVWPLAKTPLHLENVKNKTSNRPSQNELNSTEKFGVTKTVSLKGPTLLGELERRGSSTTARLKSVRLRESQLMPLKHSKVSTTNLWTCSLCGKSSFEDMLGCLFGPYNENKDALQDEVQSPGHKRKRDSTLDETESPTKSKSESSQEFWFHGDCIVWTPGVYAMGVSLAGYKQAVNDGRFRKCSYCDDFGATVTCLQRSCKKLYHFPCAKKAECVFEESNYTIQCGHHK